MQNGGMDGVSGMEGMVNNNGDVIARPELDAAAARKEAANQAVASMSRRVSGGGKTGGMVAGYARPDPDQLHKLRDVNELHEKSAAAVLQRPCNKVGGRLGLYQQRMPAMVIKGAEGGHPVGVPPISFVRGFTAANAKSGFVIHVQKLEKMVTELWAVNELLALSRHNGHTDTDQISMEEVQKLDKGNVAPDHVSEAAQAGGG